MYYKYVKHVLFNHLFHFIYRTRSINMAYQCEVCGASFSKLSLLKQHQRTENHWKKFNCELCGKRYMRKDNLDRHLKKHEASSVIHCEECGKAFNRLDNLQRHLNEKHQVGGGRKRPPAEDSDDGLTVKKLKKSDDPRQFYSIKKIREQRIEKFRTKASSYKVNFQDIEVMFR